MTCASFFYSCAFVLFVDSFICTIPKHIKAAIYKWCLVLFLAVKPAVDSSSFIKMIDNNI